MGDRYYYLRVKASALVRIKAEYFPEMGLKEAADLTAEQLRFNEITFDELTCSNGGVEFEVVPEQEAGE